MNTQALNVARQRIIVAIVKISEKLPTQQRSYVDSYINRVSPSLATQGDSMFPMSLRRHPVNPDRTIVEGRSVCLCFAIGNAVATYYDAVGFLTVSRITDVLDAETTELGKKVGVDLERRIKLIEDIAEFGFDKFVLVGDIRSGFALERSTNGVPAKQPVQAAGSSATRGGAAIIGSK